jgi:hypothetical protein
LNALSNLTSYIGLIIGIVLTTSQSDGSTASFEFVNNAQNVIFALAAGMFIYIAVADLLPALKELHIVAPVDEEQESSSSSEEVVSLDSDSSNSTSTNAPVVAIGDAKESSTSNTNDNDTKILVVDAATHHAHDKSHGGAKKGVSKVKNELRNLHPYSWPRILAQHAGLWTGWAVMLIIALFGESIKV